MSDKFKKMLPHIAAIILFFALTIIYFYPMVSEDKVLFQGDLQNMVGWGKDLQDYHQQTGDYAFWSNSMFSGMPANYSYMPPMFNIFNYLHTAINFVLPGNLSLVFLYLTGFYIFMIAIGCRPWLSIVGAIAYAFTTYNLVIIDVGHVNKALVMSTMAPVLGGIILCYRKKYLWGVIVTLISTGLNVLWGHQQISYYLLLTILVLAVVYLIYAIKEKTLKDYFKSSGLLLVVAALAVAPAVGNLISTANYSKDSMRGGAVLQKNAEGQKESSGLDIEYAFRWSYGKGETMTLLIPNFYGASSHYNVGENSEIFNLYRKAGFNAKQAGQASRYAPTYWGDQPFTAGPPYAGAIVCFLFVLGLMIVKGAEKWWLLAATVLSFVLAWGRHFEIINNFLFYHLPLYNKFRTVTQALTIAEVTMATLAVLALKEIFDHKGNLKIYLKPVYMAAGITGGLCLVFALFGSSLMSFSGMMDAQIQSQQGPEMFAAVVADRKSMLASDSWRSFIFIALATGTLWLYIHNKIKALFGIAVIGVLILVDLWTVDKRFLNYDSFVAKQREITPSEADRQILQDNDPNFRVLNRSSDTFNESRTAYFHKSIGGYSPAKLRRYQDIIDYHFTGGLNRNVLNMLNTKYVIVPAQQGLQVQRNIEALGNAWFVNGLKWVDSPDEEIVALRDFDPAKTAIIDKEWQGSLKGWESLQHEKDSTAVIRMTDYANPGNIFYESSAAMPHLAVFSEVYYKTWRVYIDGEEVPLVRVNYILRGLQVPAGNHTIEFMCIDDTYLRGAKISKIASVPIGIIILCLFGFAIWTSRKKNF